MPEGIPYASTNVVAAAGLDLNYIGNHCFAYSGTHAANSTAATALEFTTGNQYIVGEIQLNAAVNSTNPANGSSTLALIKFNGVIISIIKSEGHVDDMPNVATQKVIVPPYTNVTISVDSNDDQAAQFATVTFTGKLYK